MQKPENESREQELGDYIGETMNRGITSMMDRLFPLRDVPDPREKKRKSRGSKTRATKPKPTTSTTRRTGSR